MDHTDSQTDRQTDRFTDRQTDRREYRQACVQTDRSLALLRHFSANACLFPVCALHLAAVTTVEGIGSVAGKLHPVQVSGSAQYR